MIKIARTTIALIGIGVLLIGTGLVIGDSGVLGNLVIMAVIINTFPYFLNTVSYTHLTLPTKA